MKMITDGRLNIVLRGRVEPAKYREQELVDYRNNPLIEALPPIRTEQEIVTLLENKIHYSENERFIGRHLKSHAIQRLRHFVKPIGRNILLEKSVSRVIRDGYRGRNILSPEFVRMLNQKKILKEPTTEVVEFDYSKPGLSFALIGASGIGKSTAIDRILMTYPQVIKHKKYDRRPFPYTQLVWLKINCPHNGSRKELCISFFSAVDEILNTNYKQTYCKGKVGIDSLIESMARVAALHSLGFFVVDEIQNLNVAKAGGATAMLNYFTQLIESVGLPVMLIGTYEAARLLEDKFRQHRRMIGQGNFKWDPLPCETEWNKFIEALMKYQWTKIVVPYSEEISKTIHKHSAGIFDIAVKLYQLAQWRAINKLGDEYILDSDLINAVANDCFKGIKPMIEALHNNDYKMLQKYGDVCDVLDKILEKEGLMSEYVETEVGSDVANGRASVSKQKQFIELMEILSKSEIDTDIAHEAALIATEQNKHNKFGELIRIALEIADKIQAKKGTLPEQEGVS